MFIRFCLASLLLFVSSESLPAAEPLSGRWLLKSQTIGGRGTPTEALTLRIGPNGNAFEFAYSVPVNQVQFVSMKFASRLDGTEADVTDSGGKKIGTIRITRVGGSQYNVLLQGPNRPTASGKLSVSSDGKTLTSESDATMPNGAQTHTIQVFELQP
jgi:hypothetical protein